MSVYLQNKLIERRDGGPTWQKLSDEQVPALQTTGPGQLFYDKWLRWAMFTKNNATDGNLLAPIKAVEEGGNFEVKGAKIMIQIGPAPNYFKNRLLKQELWLPYTEPCKTEW